MKHDGLYNDLYINPIMLLCTNPKNVSMEDNVVSKCTQFC